ncbi:MarR family winged helix-turn-helix transcriptional regulator [Cryptosporangium arvum]|uniref:Transcriptional regulator n=1 Tax=Cryptosporangium arvum DSM 44712 TaxID=927661 RepID=A0A010YLG9_9ACTN|nr:MarR family transcriptional regulator [Cryptosporangium arvum]EXG81075.1 transcriptional regulator [Cryptosporangium arvum DSM 44712]
MSKRKLIEDVAVELRLLQRSFDAFDEAAASTLKLNRTDLRALDVLLASDEHLTAGELSNALKLSPAATTTVLDRLQRAGFAARIPDPGNRRRVHVAVTEAARAAERELYAPVGEAGAEALSGYDLDQLATIHHFLRTARGVQEAQAARLNS